MLAAAQRHMQQRFGGVPPPPAPDPAESIPLPGDMPGVATTDMELDDDNIPADIPAPPAPDIPIPPTPHNQPAPDVHAEMEIPLPPLPALPAACDKDSMAHMDTRPPREPTPPPPKEKTELDVMLEKHSNEGPANLPPGFAGPDNADLVTGHAWQGAAPVPQNYDNGQHFYGDIPEPDNRPVEHMGSPTEETGPDPEELRMLGIDPGDAVVS